MLRAAMSQPQRKPAIKKMKRTISTDSSEDDDEIQRINYLRRKKTMPAAPSYHQNAAASDFGALTSNIESLIDAPLIVRTPTSRVMPSPSGSMIRGMNFSLISSTSTSSLILPPITPLGTARPDVEESKTYLQKKIFSQLNEVISNQKEIMTIMRQVAAGRGGTQGEVVLEDILPNPLNSVEEMEEIDSRLQDDTYRRKMTHFLSAQGGHDGGDCIRKIMKKIGTNKLWSSYSLRGRKGKHAFQDLLLCKVVIKACSKVFPNIKITEIEDLIIETMKHAPHKPGGSKYKKRKSTACAANGQQSAANGQQSAANGHQSEANGHQSAAYGHQHAANGHQSAAYGHQSAANGQQSAAYGHQSAANGHQSAANGQQSAAN